MLENIHSPADLRRLSLDELKGLAGEIRETIIRQVATKGGHLASNLGTVELTLALHKVFDTPRDKVVWDTGHQAYPHKLVTGRYKDFHTLKQFGGLSGFLKRSESEYDAFGAGHASTSLSAALGFAAARTQKGEDYEVVGIIGDGSMTGGMAYEALNNAGEINEKITFILNDNRMSISPNVGAISKYLTRIISNPVYNRLKGEIWDLTHKMPLGGKELRSLVSRVEEGVKHTLMPGGLFEDLGIRYFGPVQGHKLEDLIEVLEAVKKMPGPNLIHVVTVKGQGWDKSERDSVKWHASVPFDIETGTPKSAPSPVPSLTKVFGTALLELARQDSRVVAITGAMPEGCGLNFMAQEMPQRVYDVGIAEPYAVTFAAGLACEGLKPVVAIYSTFLQRAIDQVIHDVAIQNLNVTFVLDRAGLVGADGPTHHGAMDLTYMRMVPGMVIMAPSDERELRDMLFTALRIDKGPVTVRYPRGNASTNEPLTSFNQLTIGKPRIVKKGRELAILAVGHMLTNAQQAVERLELEGFSPTLVDARFVKPLDKEAYLEIFNGHRAVVTVEDNVVAGGYGSGVSELMASLDVTGVHIKHIGLPDAFVTHGDIPSLFRMLEIDGEGIYQSTKSLYVALGHDKMRVASE